MLQNVMYYPNFAFMSIQRSDIPWELPQPRWDAKHNRKVNGRPFQGYGVEPFTYAGKTIEPLAWETNAKIDSLKSQLERFLNVEFYFCLVGLYEDHTVGIPMHSDEIDRDDDIIASLSFGPTRLFTVQEKGSPIVKNYLLSDGDLLIMNGAMQREAMHAVPELETPCGPRVNLTFRTKP